MAVVGLLVPLPFYAAGSTFKHQLSAVKVILRQWVGCLAGCPAGLVFCAAGSNG